MSEQVTRHRSIFGEVPTSAVHRLLDRHVRDYLSSGIAEVLFEAGDVGAVYGVRLTDGRSVLLKGFQAGVDLDRAREVTRCQSLLFHRGFPCAEVLDGPGLTDGVTIVAEGVLEHRSTGNPHERAPVRP